MSIDGVSGRTSYIGSGILNLRSQLDTLTEQLASGKVSNTYAGQGAGRSLALGIRAQVNSCKLTNIDLSYARFSAQRMILPDPHSFMQAFLLRGIGHVTIGKNTAPVRSTVKGRSSSTWPQACSSTSSPGPMT